jgi:hypothetical protein
VRRRVATAAVAVALLAAGCGGSEEPAAVGEVPPPSTTGSTEPTSTTASTAEIKQAVLDAYLAGWKAKHVSNDPPDPEFPALAETHTGPALDQAVENRQAFQVTGRVGRFPEDSIAERRAEVVSVGAEEAVVRDCSVDDSQIVIAATGEAVNDLVATVLFEGSMVVEDGQWKLRSLKVVEEWEGVAGCAAEF